MKPLRVGPTWGPAAHGLRTTDRRPGFGKDHVIVVPKHHVRSLLELDAALAAHLLEVVRTAARDVVARHGGCQVLTTLGDEQRNRHLHLHIAAGDGVARFVSPD